MTELKTLLEPAPTTQPDGPPPSREAVEALGPFTPPGDFRSRPSGQIPHVGYVTKLHTSVFDALRARTATSPAHMIVRTPDVQYNAYQASTTGKIILAEATELKPVYQGDYDKLRDRLLANSVRQLRESFGDFWDATEKRHLRTKYKPAER